MSNDLFYGSVQDFETAIQIKVAAEREGRQVVSNGHYAAITVAMFVIVGCLAAQNALYGYSQGSTYTAMVLLAVMYFAGDWALAALTSLSTKKQSARYLSFIAKTGLVLLSVTAGVSFMLSQQHANDVSNSRVASIEADIEANQAAFEKYHKTITAERLAGLRKELEAERSRVGADHASSNAVYVYLSHLTGYSFEVVSFSVRTLWTVVFIVTGMTLSTLLGVLWCPWKESRAHSKFIAEQRSALRRMKAHTKLMQQHEALIQGSSRPGKSRKPQQGRAPTQDTGTSGKTSHRYKEVRNKVSSGQVKPSIKSLKRLGMGTNTAQDYLKQLHSEGVIQKSGQGYITAAMQ